MKRLHNFYNAEEAKQER